MEIVAKLLSVGGWGWENKEFVTFCSILAVMIRQLFHIKDGNAERKNQHTFFTGKFALTDYKIDEIKTDTKETVQKADLAIDTAREAKDTADKAEEKAEKAVECVEKIETNVNTVKQTVENIREDWVEFIENKHKDSLTKEH